ncbi:MAG: ATP-binding cassette domain-containing protein [Streptosporangiales bacterium]|nr:ATP-binding cassette domain-containing protein [Streptosporangiales bacterium]
MISARAVSFGYDDNLVLDDVDLRVRHRQVVGLVGPNGSGKSTLLRTLYGRLEPRAGMVTMDGSLVHGLGPRDLAGRVAVVARDGGADLPLRCLQVVLLGRSPHRPAWEPFSADDHQLAVDALAQVDAAHLADRDFATLSSGEQQRVLIARTLAQQAEHLLLDELATHLDVRYQHELLQLVRTLPVTTVLVLQDLNLAARYCDELVLLDRGRLVSAGTPGEVLRAEVLEPVYGLRVRRIDDDGIVQLVFTPKRSTRPVAPPRPTADTASG